MASWSSERRDDIGNRDDADSSLLDVVVIIIRLLMSGNRAMSCALSCEIVVEAGTGSDKVGGRLRPEKEVSKILIILVDMPTNR